MAQRRMLSKKITDTDNFIDMPLGAQALYFHLNVNADDEGFIDKVKVIRRTIGASEDDLKILIAKGYLIPFESGVVVIRHWRIHNYIQSDRFQPTVHQFEKEQLVYDKTKTAHIRSEVDTKCIQNVTEVDTQYRLGKDRLDKDRLEIEVEAVEGSYKSKPTQFQEFLKIYEENKLSPVQLPPLLLEEIQKDLSENLFSIELFKCAVLDATSQGIFNYKYIRAILDGYRKRGLTTAEEVKQEQLAKEKNEGKVVLDASTRVGGYEEPPF